VFACLRNCVIVFDCVCLCIALSCVKYLTCSTGLKHRQRFVGAPLSCEASTANALVLPGACSSRVPSELHGQRTCLFGWFACVVPWLCQVLAAVVCHPCSTGKSTKHALFVRALLLVRALLASLLWCCQGHAAAGCHQSCMGKSTNNALLIIPCSFILVMLFCA